MAVSEKPRLSSYRFVVCAIPPILGYPHHKLSSAGVCREDDRTSPLLFHIHEDWIPVYTYQYSNGFRLFRTTEGETEPNRENLIFTKQCCAWSILYRYGISGSDVSMYLPHSFTLDWSTFMVDYYSFGSYRRNYDSTTSGKDIYIGNEKK